MRLHVWIRSIRQLGLQEKNMRNARGIFGERMSLSARILIATIVGHGGSRSEVRIGL
jgi:hypothetical protein